MKSYKDKVLDRIKDQCKILYDKVDKSQMVMGDMNYNFRCHLNSVQYVKEGKAKDSYLCVSIDDSDFVCVHFINKNNDGKFVDNTWGWLYEQADYYIVRKVNESEYNDIWNLLDKMKKNLVFNNSNSFLRKIHRIDYKEII